MDIEEETETIGEDHPKASSICAIDKKSVHRICSGQVVLTLGTAVKELLENSIDAGATIVDIKLKEYGSELIEVSDNGLGVHPVNFGGLTLKHHTSKLRDFGDLINVDTFGFRGEALSSLCALCDLNVTTRHKDEAVGTKLEFDHNGQITKKEAQARQVGTKVVLQNLFYTLPVRHKEFQRNVKKDFVKMVQVLNSYCIISTGVRITCTNVTNKGSRSTVVSSQGNVLLQENISNVFGPKQIQSLLEFKQKEPGEDVCSEYGLKGTAPSLFKIEGFVSKCEHGHGRSSTDRQFFYINGRPFDSTKVTKVLNEVYHQYNRHQYPFVVLKVGVNKEGVDVNVTPDKRQVFMEGEKILLATIKSSLIAMFESTTSILQMHQPDITSKLVRRRSEPVTTENCMRLSNDASLRKSNNVVSSLSKLKRSFSSAFAKPTDMNDNRQSPSKCSPFPKQRRMDCFVSKAEPLKSDEDVGAFHGHSIKLNELETEELLTSNYMMSNDKDVFDRDNTDRLTIGRQPDSFCVESSADHNGSVQDVITVDETGDHSTSVKKSNNLDIDQTTANATHTDDTSLGNFDVLYTLTQHSGACKVESGNERTSSIDESGYTGHRIDHSATDEPGTKEDFVDRCHSHSIQTNDTKTQGISISFHSGNSDNLHCSKEMNRNDSELSTETENYPIEVIPHEPVDQVECGEVDDHQVDDAEDFSKAETKISFSFEDLKQKWKKRCKEESKGSFSRTFRATINPSDNQAAEQELQKEIKKESFSQMEICGQFNMGFIITKLGEDLFIVDQHASDEKYNFETLQRDTVIQSQKLICPMNLELIASNETILMDNLDVFKKNGFEFMIDEQGPPTQRVKLTSTPVSKNWNFGKEDIEEMIFMLTDSTGVMCRPSRVRAMFASRACRKSIMIGTVLNKSEMRKLLFHMGEIEQPWNCPHGRPTMRHLINLDMIPK